MIHAAALLLYIVAFVLWLRSLLGGTSQRSSADRVSAAAGRVAVVAVLVHFAALTAFTLEWDQLPLVGLAPSLSTLALLTGVGLLFTLQLGEASRVGLVLVPLVILLEGSALLLGLRPAGGDLDFRGAWFALHVTLALASLGAMAVSAAAGLFYLLQFRQLKSRTLGRAFHFLPPLVTLDRVGDLGVVTALVTLSLSLLLGWAWTVGFRNSLQVGDPKIIWAIFVWLLIGAALLARRGAAGERRGAAAAVAAFGLIVVSYLVVRGSLGGGFFL